MAWLDVLNIAGLWNGGTPVPADEDNPLPVADSGEREYSHHCETVTASGDTTLITPTGSNRIRLHWVYAINDPTSSSATLIKLSLGATELYRVYALSKRQLKTGGAGEALVMNLSQAASVAVTIIYEEIP
jgi:hypothetical protein